MRQVGTWDPLWQCHNACTKTHPSLSNKMQRNYMGLKITVCMHSWGKFWTKDKNHQKTQLPLLKSSEQVQGTVVLCVPPAYTTTKGVCKPPKPPLWPGPWTHTSPHLNKEQTQPFGSQQQRNLLFVIASPLAVAGAPVKPSLEKEEEERSIEKHKQVTFPLTTLEKSPDPCPVSGASWRATASLSKDFIDHILIRIMFKALFNLVPTLLFCTVSHNKTLYSESVSFLKIYALFISTLKSSIIFFPLKKKSLGWFVFKVVCFVCAN